jgi:Domain of unknown function (DUF4494)
MPEWFHTKVKFLKQNENGLIKAVTEQYLVDALSFTEAEARVQQEVSEGQREVTLVSVARSNIREVVVYGDTDLWFKVKVTYVVNDEESEKNKKVTLYLLVNANDVQEAYERTQEHLKEMLVPFQIPKVEETPINEVYEHVAGLRSSMRKLTPEERAAQEAALPDQGPARIQPKEVDFQSKFKVPKNDDDLTDDFEGKVGDEEE